MRRLISPPPPIRFLISAKAMGTLRRYLQTGDRLEAGGMLLGEWHPEERTVRVLFASRPNARDRRTRTTFDRDAAASTRIATHLWRWSEGRVHLLGEWHTHPEARPRPSFKDEISIGHQLRCSTVVAGGLLLVIVGRRQNWVGFCQHHRWTLVRLEVEA